MPFQSPSLTDIWRATWKSSICCRISFSLWCHKWETWSKLLTLYRCIPQHFFHLSMAAGTTSECTMSEKQESLRPSAAWSKWHNHASSSVHLENPTGLTVKSITLEVAGWFWIPPRRFCGIHGLAFQPKWTGGEFMRNSQDAATVSLYIWSLRPLFHSVRWHGQHCNRAITTSQFSFQPGMLKFVLFSL